MGSIGSTAWACIVKRYVSPGGKDGEPSLGGESGLDAMVPRATTMAAAAANDDSLITLMRLMIVCRAVLVSNER